MLGYGRCETMKKTISIDPVFYEMLLEVAKKNKPSPMKPDAWIEAMIKTAYIRGN